MSPFSYRGLTRRVPHWSDDGLSLPVDIDFSTIGDGDLPSPLSGDTWAILSGVAINAPTLGSELLTDPGLESTYTGGLCDTLTQTGTPTVAQSGDVHGGSKAQSFTATAFGNRLQFPVVALTSGSWYMASVWCKLTTAHTSIPTIWLNDGTAGYDQRQDFGEAADYTQYGFLFPGFGNNTKHFPVRDRLGVADFTPVIVDDGSIRAVSFADLVAWLPAAQSDVILKILVDPATYGSWGVVARANDSTNPTDFIVLWAFQAGPGTISITVNEHVSGSPTNLLAPTIVTTVADAALELHLSNTTAQVFYNDAQVGGDLTVTGTTGQRHGMLAIGEATPNRFFVLAN